MPVIHFILPDGEVREQTAAIGASVMEAAKIAAIEEIVAECGGSLSCATCHVFVAPDWIHALPPATEDETDLLEGVPELRDGSRLSCQIRMTETLDGLRIEVPENQF